MAYIRTKTTRTGRDQIVLVESKRVHGRPRQRVIVTANLAEAGLVRRKVTVARLFSDRLVRRTMLVEAESPREVTVASLGGGLLVRALGYHRAWVKSNRQSNAHRKRIRQHFGCEPLRIRGRIGRDPLRVLSAAFHEADVEARDFLASKRRYLRKVSLVLPHCAEADLLRHVPRGMLPDAKRLLRQQQRDR